MSKKIEATDCLELYKQSRVGGFEGRFETKSLNFEYDGLASEVRDKATGQIYKIKITPLGSSIKSEPEEGEKEGEK